MTLKYFVKNRSNVNYKDIHKNVYLAKVKSCRNRFKDFEIVDWN